MERRPGILRRYGLAVSLVTVMGYILVTTTLPAAVERDRMRAERAAQQAQHQALQEEVAERQAWLHGIRHDPLLQRRLAEQRLLTPEIWGPILQEPDPAAPSADAPAALKVSRPTTAR
jgi:hypothetical protein